jgi:hypothetical protein
MPYIKKDARLKLDLLTEMLESNIENVGELNYVITRLAVRHLIGMGLSYQNISTVYGTLQLAAAEFWQRLVVPYEKRKCFENGDVPELENIFDKPTNL